jgi:hypothetical protein
MKSKFLPDLRFVGSLTLAGLVSGGLTANLSMNYLDGFLFGVILALALTVSGITDRLWKLPCIVVLSTVAFFISWMLMFETAYHLPGGHFSWGGVSTVSPYSLFTAGMTGGFVVFGGTLLLVNPEIRLRSLVLSVIGGSVLGGSLAVIGWALGPSLGPWMVTPQPWEVNVGTTAFGDTRLHHSALLVVWQAGMAFALGVNLRSYRPSPKPEELKLV